MWRRRAGVAEGGPLLLPEAPPPAALTAVVADTFHTCRELHLICSSSPPQPPGTSPPRDPSATVKVGTEGLRSKTYKSALKSTWRPGYSRAAPRTQV